MAGGIFTVQNKVRPGFYYKFKGAPRAKNFFGIVGVAALPLELDWGAAGQFISIDSDSTTQEYEISFGSPKADILSVRECMKRAQTLLAYRVNGNGEAAKLDMTPQPVMATAKYTGIRGNDIAVQITEDVDSPGTYIMTTYVDSMTQDEQSGITDASDLVSNDWVVFSGTGAITGAAGGNLTGGANGTATLDDYNKFLSLLEQQDFNCFGLPAEDTQLKTMFSAACKRMNEELGLMVQCVIPDYTQAGYEAVMSPLNGVVLDDGTVIDKNMAVCWLTGAAASAYPGKAADAYSSLTYSAYEDPTQGIEGAGFAIKEMLGGQFTSLKSRFGFSSSDIEEIKNGAKTIEDVMNNLDKVLERRGSTDETLEKFEQSASSVLDTIKGKFQTRFSEIGAVVLEKLMPALEQVSEWLDSPQADEFFNALASGLALLVGGFLWLAQTGAAAFQWISDHGQILLPILIGLAAGVLLFQAAMAIMNVVMLAGQLAMTSFGNAALLASLKIALLPILIGLLIAGLVHLMKKFEWVREGVALVVGAIVIFFMWMVGEVLRLVQNMVNFVIDAINVLISILNNLPGVNIDMIENATFADDFKAKHADDGVNAANWILDTFGESESTDKAGNPADDLSQMLDDLLNSVGNVDDWANGGSSGGSSGGAPVTVTNDVDEELVKLLREREEGIILRQHYTEDNSMYFENTNLTGVSEGQSMEEVFDEFVTRISEANASQPSQAYGGKAL